MPGFYLLAGPDWHGEVPAGITQVFRSSTNTGFIAPVNLFIVCLTLKAFGDTPALGWRSASP